ncbi:glycosyltransferase [Chloroflexota bacterium]
MVKVLYTTPVLKHPPMGGPQLSVENCIKALSKESELHIISRVPISLIGGIEAQKFYEQYCVNFLYSPMAGSFSPPRMIKFQTQALNSALAYCRRIKFLNQVGGFFFRLYFDKFLHKSQKRRMDSTNQDVNFILKYFEEYSIDVIWCDRGIEHSFDLIYKIKKKRPDIKVVCDTCAVNSRFILRGLPYEKSLSRKSQIYRAGKKKKKEERILVNLADITTAVSEVDAQYYRSIAKVPAKIQLFSNVIDIETYEKIPPPADSFKKPCIYLAGTFFSPQSPMADAARWVITAVLPLVRQQIPNIHFYIVGRGSDETLLEIDDPGITVTGELPSVLPYLCHADVALVPLRFESGTCFKILEAGACCIPIVSTTIGAEGLSVTHEKNILIADEPKSFADSIISIIKNHDLALEIAKNLKTLVYENHNIASLAEEGRLILEYLMCGKNSHRG